MARIGFAGNKSTTLECMNQFIRDGFNIDILITLTHEEGDKHKVADYFDLRPFAKAHEIPIYHPHTYSLKSDVDRQALLDEKIELLLVIGWQRLIPGWFLEALPFGAFGMHGSPEPLPRGRGRSPMNWALLNGKTSFMTHLFRYDQGIDSGSIVGMQKFDITPWDTAGTLHMKNRIAMNRLLRSHLPAILNGTVMYMPQNKDIAPTYFPKRTAEDGRIVWDNQTMKDLYDHIRCQTMPFPGAFSYLEGHPKAFYFWSAHPFDGHLIYYGEVPGTVVETFHDGSFLVAVWDGTVRVCQYTSPFGCAPIVKQRFYNLPKGADNEQDHISDTPGL